MASQRTGFGHVAGAFVVKFFGTGELAWLGHESVIPWSENDHRSRFAANASKASFKRSLEEAREAFDERKQERVRAYWWLLLSGEGHGCRAHGTRMSHRRRKSWPSAARWWRKLPGSK